MITSDLSFNADWVSPPGNTLKDLIEHQGKSLAEFAISMECGTKELTRLINGEIQINSNVAFKLEGATGTSAKFWLEREKQYRRAIDRLEYQNKVESEWLSKVPTADMSNFGWIEKVSDRREKLLACLKFFDTFSVDDWQRKYNGLLAEAAFRTSQSFSSTNESIAAWLRQGEIEASRISCSSWNKAELIKLIPEIRSLTTIEGPAVFLPTLKKLLASCGVALAVVRAPKGCHASGATFWPTQSNPILILSFRYLSDDHFWFTIFHEIGHLVLHSDHRLIIETEEKTGIDIENEADKFSENVLIPSEFQNELRALRAKNLRKILKFAKKIGVSKGIIVGQLQHKGIIPKNYLNKLKVRYSW